MFLVILGGGQPHLLHPFHAGAISLFSSLIPPWILLIYKRQLYKSWWCFSINSFGIIITNVDAVIVIAIIFIITCGCKLKRRICKWQQNGGLIIPNNSRDIDSNGFLCAHLIICWRLWLAHLVCENTWTAAMDSENNALGFKQKTIACLPIHPWRYGWQQHLDALNEVCQLLVIVMLVTVFSMVQK